MMDRRSPSSQHRQSEPTVTQPLLNNTSQLTTAAHNEVISGEESPIKLNADTSMTNVLSEPFSPAERSNKVTVM